MLSSFVSVLLLVHIDPLMDGVLVQSVRDVETKEDTTREVDDDEGRQVQRTRDHV